MRQQDESKVGPNHPTHQWPEYRQLRDAVEQYVQHDPPDPTYNHLSQALGAILGEHYREKFRRAHGLSEPAETACIGRLIDGRDECPHNVVEQDDDPNAPPHSPPIDDHSTLWLNDDDEKEPAVYSMHIYQSDLEHSIGDGPDNRWFDIIDFVRHHGLEIGVRDSWYNPGSCQQIVIYPPNRR